MNLQPIKALFVGLNTVDLQFFVKDYPRENTKTKAHRNEIAAGGPATNAAITAAFLGANATLVTPIGKHALNRLIADDIVKHNVRLIDPIENIDANPIFASIISNELTGERTICSYHPKPNVNILLQELCLGSLESYNIALFDGFYLDLSIVLAKALKEKGVTTVLDGGSWKPGLEDLLPYIDIAICSNDFSVPQAKTKYDNYAYFNEIGITKLAITQGEKPILVRNGIKTSELEVKKINAIDTLGAGDIFHGAFCYYYAFQPNFDLALTNAAKIAGISCQYHGTRSWMKKMVDSSIAI